MQEELGILPGFLVAEKYANVFTNICTRIWYRVGRYIKMLVHLFGTDNLEHTRNRLAFVARYATDEKFRDYLLDLRKRLHEEMTEEEWEKFFWDARIQSLLEIESRKGRCT